MCVCVSELVCLCVHGSEVLLEVQNPVERPLFLSSPSVYVCVCVCACACVCMMCVCVCKRESVVNREREGRREKETLIMFVRVRVTSGPKSYISRNKLSRAFI